METKSYFSLAFTMAWGKDCFVREDLIFGTNWHGDKALPMSLFGLLSSHTGDQDNGREAESFFVHHHVECGYQRMSSRRLCEHACVTLNM